MCHTSMVKMAFKRKNVFQYTCFTEFTYNGRVILQSSSWAMAPKRGDKNLAQQ